MIAAVVPAGLLPVTALPVVPWEGDDDLVVAVASLQFHVGGLVDAEPHGQYVHLVRSIRGGGTPGPSLCGLDRFHPLAPGWSVGGGVTPTEQGACPMCVSVARTQYPGRPVLRGTHHGLFAAAGLAVTA